jgi:predicted ATPase/DNA-binding SARP family transcriptional activator/DNA-binding CsgD family transcriptional regulator
MDADELEIRLLGPFDVRQGGGPVGPAGSKRRGLLALLALRAGRVVPVSELIDGLWGDAAPASAANLVQTYVSAWRKALEADRPGRGGGSRIVTVGPGYRLYVMAGELDLERCGDLLARGRGAAAAGRNADAAGLLSGALELWRGPPLADLAREPFYPAAAERLSELYLQVVEAWATAALAAGNGDDVAAVLRQPRERAPFRERLCELLMWALFQEGRQADALAVYEDIRRVLADELGADPGPGLQDMHLRVLRQDAALRVTATVPTLHNLPLLHGLAPALTSFVGRAGEVDEVAGLLGEYRLVTVTGPGGVGKTRLAGEVARRAAGNFADGVWLVELAAVQEPALVPAAVAAALGVPQAPGMSVVDSLAEVLARQQLLLVLDNCEHVLGAVAELCGALLPAADDVRVLATSRELLGVAGEARFRVPPLGLPGPGEQAETGGSEAVALFTDRARRVDPQFVLSGESGPVVARLVARLDGMPLAIELAAARVEALGVTQLLDRLDDRFRLLVGGDRLAAARQRSLAATVDWSYQLLSEPERRVFRRLSAFPAPFTLDAAEAVAGADAAPVVLHLVDCSLLAPPRIGPDGRARYLMLETLREFGAQRLADAGEQPGAATALAQHAVQVAEEAAAGMQTSAGELAAARWLDAEDAAVHQALAWALEHDPAMALRLAMALAPWWRLRGRFAAGYALLRAAAEHAARDDEAWCAAQYWLGVLASYTDMAGALGHFTAVRDVEASRGPSPALADGLTGRSAALRNLDRIPEAAEDARRALALARGIGYLAGEAMALLDLAAAAYYAGDPDNALAWARQAQRIDPADIPGWVARRSRHFLAYALFEAGEAVAAQRSCADGLARARQTGALQDQAEFLHVAVYLDRQAGQIAQAAAHLREALELASRIGYRSRLIGCLDHCAHLCAATQRWADAVTLWAAYHAHLQDDRTLDVPLDALRRQEPTQKAAQALGPGRMRAAEERGAAMTLATAAEFAALLATAAGPRQPQPPHGLGQLSPRERELITLVAQGRTDAQVAGQLYMSVSTVRSHLDRIRDKTACRRRADLTRLALQVGLV